MLRGTKSDAELRFEFLTLGVVLISAAVCWLLFRDSFPSLILFVPGLVVIGSAIFQDMQPDWKAGWITYILAGLVVATGLAGLINQILGDVIDIKVQWWIIAVVELGALFIAKALYDPNIRNQ